jgi:dipeptidase E
MVKSTFYSFAAVTFSYDDYEKKVQERFREIGHDVISIHHYSDPVKAVMNAPALVVGGGNTWMLLKLLRETG